MAGLIRAQAAARVGVAVECGWRELRFSGDEGAGRLPTQLLSKGRAPASAALLFACSASCLGLGLGLDFDLPS